MEDEISSLMSMMPEALIDTEKTLLTLKQSSTAGCKRLISFLEKEDAKNKKFYEQLLEQKRLLKEEIKQQIDTAEHIKKEVYEMDLQQNILRNNIITLKQSLTSEKKQFPDNEELSKLMEEVSSLKEDIGKKKSFLRNMHQKYKKGILFHKKYLHSKVMLDSKDTVVITLDTAAKSASEAREFLKFSVDGQDSSRSFQFLEMRPKLKNEQQLVRTYNETGDIQGFIVSFWNAITNTKSRKILCEKNTG